MGWKVLGPVRESSRPGVGESQTLSAHSWLLLPCIPSMNQPRLFAASCNFLFSKRFFDKASCLYVCSCAQIDNIDFIWQYLKTDLYMFIFAGFQVALTLVKVARSVAIGSRRRRRMRQLATGKGKLVAKERDETADHPASSLNSSEKIGKQMKEEQLAIERRKMRQMATCSSGELQLAIASH